MVLNKFTGSVLMDGNEDDLFKVFGTTLKHFASYVYLKALQAGDSIRIRVYDKVDDVSRYKLDGDVNDSVGSNNGTVTNISSFVSQWKFDGNVNDSVGANNGTITYNTSLKALYKFDNTINDSTSGAHNLTLAAGTTTYVTGKEGQALSFDGSTAYTANSAVVVTGANDRSVSCWFKTPATFVGGSVLWSWGVQTNNNAFGLNTADSGSISRVSLFGWNNDLTSTLYLQPNTWYHIVGTLGTANSGTVKTIYINGVQDSTATQTALNTTSSSLFLGERIDGSAKLTGTIDEFRIYSITLSASQVSALYMNGKFGQSHTFDGGEYITMANESQFDFERTNTFSVSFWAKTTGISQAFISKNTGNGTTGWLIDSGASSQIVVRLINTATTNEISVNTGSAVINDGLWHHVVMTYSGSSLASGVHIYIDGVSQSLTTVTNNLSATILNNQSVVVGAEGDFGRLNTGQIDEMRVYSSELTASQVLGLYNYTGSNYITPLPVGNALSLDGSSYVTVPNQTPYNFERTNTWSVSFWVKTTETSGVHAIFSNQSGANFANRGWGVFSNGGQLLFMLVNTISTNCIEATGVTINDGNWHNVIVTYNGNSNVSGLSQYVDGVSQSIGTVTNNLSATIQSGLSLNIGGGTTAGTKISGLLDEMQIFNYVLSAGEIANINAGRFGNTHPIGLWHFDGDLYDYSGQGSTGIPTGTIEYVTGALSGSYTVPNDHFNFDGSEYVTCGSTSTWIFLHNAFLPSTISFWINAPTSLQNINIIFFTDNEGAGAGCQCYIDNNYKIHFYVWNGSNYVINDVASTNAISSGRWHHIMIVNNNGYSLYIDGVLDHTQSLTGNVPSALNSAIPLLIGSNYNYQLICGLDDVRIYNRALSAGEVLDLFNYPDSPMKELIYDRTYSGVKTDAIYVPMLQGNQYKVTCQQTSGTNRIIPFERWEVT